MLLYRFTGCRRQEALALQADDLDFSARTIRIGAQYFGGGRLGVTKGKRVRVVDMADPLVEPLRDAIRRSDALAKDCGVPREPRWLFRSPYRPEWPLNPGYINHALVVVRTEAGVPAAQLKSFRHSLATLLMQRGESPEYVRRTLGHRDLATTLRYTADRRMSRPKALEVLADPTS
jgi:integrase